VYSRLQLASTGNVRASTVPSRGLSAGKRRVRPPQAGPTLT
jgi:hypothetical protein